MVWNWVTHGVEEMLYTCEEVLVLEKALGKVIIEKSKEDLLREFLPLFKHGGGSFFDPKTTQGSSHGSWQVIVDAHS